MKKFSFISPSGKVITVDGVGVVNIRKLDAVAQESMALAQMWQQVQLLALQPIEYQPTIAVSQTLKNN